MFTHMSHGFKSEINRAKRAEQREGKKWKRNRKKRDSNTNIHTHATNSGMIHLLTLCFISIHIQASNSDKIGNLDQKKKKWKKEEETDHFRGVLINNNWTGSHLGGFVNGWKLTITLTINTFEIRNCLRHCLYLMAENRSQIIINSIATHLFFFVLFRVCSFACAISFRMGHFQQIFKESNGFCWFCLLIRFSIGPLALSSPNAGGAGNDFAFCNSNMIDIIINILWIFA